jgi:SAM-dependent methyltransferase
LPAHAKYYCLDISLNMLRRAARSLRHADRKAHLFHADAQYLPFKDETFDVIFQMGGLQFMADPFNAAREMARVAKGRATILILDEISGAERMFRRLPAHAPHAIGREDTLKALPRLVPPGYQTLQAGPLPSGEFYVLSFTNQA